MRAAIFQDSTAGLAPADRLGRLADVAAEADAGLLVCPELFMSGYAAGEAIRHYAEPSDGSFANGVAEIARTTETAIVYGYPEAADGVIYNAAQCIDASGHRLANHRKVVLPPGFETDYFATGNGLTVFELCGMRFVLLICYETEFPEAVRTAALAGAHAVLAPTALAAQWGVVANQAIPSRAFENGVHVLYANHAGREGDVTYLGGSCIVGPDGKDLARAGDRETVIAADLDPSRVAAAQERLPYLKDLAALQSRLV